MKYLTVDEVVAMHSGVIKQFGGLPGIHSFDLLYSAIERPKATFGGDDLYETIFDKAAALIHSLILNHPFVDGNKRTAFVSLARFLYINKVKFMANQREIVSYFLNIEQKKPTIRLIASWINKHCQ